MNIYTSCGIIKNRETHRVGVCRITNEMQDEIFGMGSIDVSYEQALSELTAANPKLSEEEIERELECFESRLILIGHWKKDERGNYSPDKSKEFAAEVNLETNICCVVWSTHTRSVHHTSPCYVMADGSGPCGDLDTPGDSVIAFDLPASLKDSE